MEDVMSNSIPPQLQEAKEDNNKQQTKYDEILIDFLIQNPCLWDKSDSNFRNRMLKDLKWRDIAGKMNMAAHEAIRRYKTLCERFRREMIKQSSIPNYASSWSLFDKFASLKDAQMSDDKRTRVKTEDSFDTEMVDLDALMAAAAAAGAVSATKKRRKQNNSASETSNGCNELNETNGTSDECTTNGANSTGNDDSTMPNIFDVRSIDEDEEDSSECLNVEPTYIGGSTDLATDTIAAFCQFIEASLKQMTPHRSDDVIEDISGLLFRRKREYRRIDEQNGDQCDG